VLELVQCTEGLMEAAGTVSFLGALGHHTGLEQGYIQGLMAHSLGFLDLSDSPTTQVTGENGRVPNLQGSVLWGRSSLVSMTSEPELLFILYPVLRLCP